MSARTAGIVLAVVTGVGVVAAVLGFVIVAQANSYSWVGSGLLQLGIMLAVIPLGMVLIRVLARRRRDREH
jgi:hypothetical protein